MPGGQVGKGSSVGSSVRVWWRDEGRHFSFSHNCTTQPNRTGTRSAYVGREGWERSMISQNPELRVPDCILHPTIVLYSTVELPARRIIRPTYPLPRRFARSLHPRRYGYAQRPPPPPGSPCAALGWDRFCLCPVGGGGLPTL